MNTTQKTQRLTVSAVMLAFATVLALVCEMIPFLNLPFGGGFTVASMLPIVIISYMYGIKWGFFASFTYSVIQIMISIIKGSTVMALFTPSYDGYMGGIGIAIAIIVIDYLVAYTILGIGGIFRNRIQNKIVALVLGVILALSLRYICHIISGYIFYGEWAEWFFSQEGFYAIGEKILGTFSGKGLALIYSVFYNGLFMIPEIIITAIVTVPIAKITFISKK